MTQTNSVLETLKGLGRKTVSQSSPLASQINDPAISGAKLTKNTVKLGIDPSIMKVASHCAELKVALERAAEEFSLDQATMRDYGAAKRGIYNDVYKADVTTVCVPYEIQVQEGETVRTEVKYVQVICSHKFSVQTEMVLANKERIGPSYDRLFVEERTKSLKPNAEEVIKQVLTEVGLKGEELDNAMNNLFEEVVKVKASSTYEAEYRKLHDDAKVILDQAVTRSAPALKFG